MVCISVSCCHLHTGLGRIVPKDIVPSTMGKFATVLEHATRALDDAPVDSRTTAATLVENPDDRVL